MKPLLLATALAATCLSLLTACADPSHAGEAEDLRAKLADLPGVASATLDYSEPVILDSAKLVVQVAMHVDADADAITKVIGTTYDAFAGTHHGEEGDLDVTIGDDRLHLRSFKPDADVEDVEQAARDALPVLADGAVVVDINTQDVARDPRVETWVQVAVEQPGVRSLLGTVTRLAQRHPGLSDVRWSVQSGGEHGWRLGTERGFPDQEQLALFADLRADLPAGAALMLDNDEFTTVQLPATTPAADVVEMARRHLDVLGGADSAWYDVQSGYELFFSVTGGECFFDTAAIGTILEREFGGLCSSVIHPDPA